MILHPSCRVQRPHVTNILPSSNISLLSLTHPSTLALLPALSPNFISEIFVYSCEIKSGWRRPGNEATCTRGEILMVEARDAYQLNFALSMRRGNSPNWLEAGSSLLPVWMSEGGLHCIINHWHFHTLLRNYTLHTLYSLLHLILLLELTILTTE